ncbi:sensor histidine kinase [Crocinitomix catalasitica]|uniref:sensor histidine kinase n=1 Tax=Crocinitomix catalasitica TaxID=184607 RepID=UPI000487BE10|nr:histidine kinase [Crocinitomix catalasitica]
MTFEENQTRKYWYEAFFQVFLVGMVFVFYAFERKRGGGFSEFDFEISTVLFFLNYVVAAFFINYVLLPKFLYPKKYWTFGLSVLAVIAIVIVIEEGVIEQIYFPDTRGASFPGVFRSLTDSLPTITILAGFKFAWDALNKQKEVDELKSAVKESELQFLKSQINPHFLFNNLNNLYAYALESSPKTPQIILELSNVLRYMLYECKEEFVPLGKEIDQLESFVNLSQLQFEDRGTISFDAQHINSGYQIAPLILSVFIENAFKHSASSQTDDIEIGIAIDLDEKGSLKFHCRNTFTEDTNTNDLAHGIGLENVKKRLTLLYPNSHTLSIDSRENIFDVHLKINLKVTQ